MAQGNECSVMYHVTNVDADKPANDDHENWTEVRLCVPNDETFDGTLKGLPVACFTTTQHLRAGNLPDLSPYPRHADNKSRHWRFRTPFDPHNYRIFKVHEIGFQVDLLCLRKQVKGGSDVERHLADLLSYMYPDWELQLPDYAGYFPRGKANIYNDPNFEGPQQLITFVNVHFIHPVQIRGGLATWDVVARTSRGSSEPHGIDGNLTLMNEYDEKPVRALLAKWIIDHVTYRYANEDGGVSAEVAQCLLDLFGAIKEANETLFLRAPVPPSSP